jgi:hypothetical protein
MVTGSGIRKKISLIITTISSPSTSLSNVSGATLWATWREPFQKPLPMKKKPTKRITTLETK